MQGGTSCFYGIRTDTNLLINTVGIEGQETEITNSYNLLQNYPNPFNPVTKINFAISKPALVTLKVYDMLGREVASLVNEFKQAGYYSLDFNASKLSSGIYFYKLQANDFTDIKKMILLK